LKKREKISGIYKITNPKGKIYVGQSIDIIGRWNVYKNKQAKNQPKLFNSLGKYGYDHHMFEILEICDHSLLHEREIFFKKHYLKKSNDDWNMVLFCELYDRGGGPRSDQTKEKMSKSQLGKILSPESRKKIGDANRGTIFPPEVRKLMGRKKGSVYSKDDKLKISQGLKGKPKPEGFGEKISKSNSGRRKTENEITHLQNHHPLKKSILQIHPITLDIVNEFSSMKEAGRKLNINPNGITEVVNGRQKTSSGFIWKLKE
jgi:group I intron endonuclease